MPDTVHDPLSTPPPPAAPYLGRLSAEDRLAYETCGNDLDLDGEIRLMRAVLAHLAADIPANHRSMATVLGVLVRAVSLQASRLGGGSDLEATLLDAADAALEDL